MSIDGRPCRAPLTARRLAVRRSGGVRTRSARYVHGGFAGTDTRFSIYFPPPEQYQGRFFQHITPVPDSEHLAQGRRGRARTRSASRSPAAPTSSRPTAAGRPAGPGPTSTRRSGVPRQRRRRARTRVSSPPRCTATTGPTAMSMAAAAAAIARSAVPRTRPACGTASCRTSSVRPMAIPNMFTVRMHAQRILRDELDRIVDAVEPGGSGDIYAGLDAEQARRAASR